MNKKRRNKTGDIQYVKYDGYDVFLQIRSRIPVLDIWTILKFRPLQGDGGLDGSAPACHNKISRFESRHPSEMGNISYGVAKKSSMQNNGRDENPSYFSLYKNYESYKNLPYGALISLANHA